MIQQLPMKYLSMICGHGWRTPTQAIYLLQLWPEDLHQLELSLSGPMIELILKQILVQVW
jgi:hypothetical protein